MAAPANPPVALNRLEALRGLNMSIWEGVCATVFGVLTGGAFLTGFALLLHASPFVMGLMAGLPAVVGLLQLPASVWTQRSVSRRPIVAYCAMSGRGLFALVLLIPFLVPSALRQTVFLVLLTASAGLVTITTPAWTSWMSDLVPPASRGQYFGRRNMIAGIVSLIAPLPAGAFLDHAVRQSHLPPRYGFAILFALGVAAAAVSFVLLLRQPEPPSSARAVVDNPLRTLTEPLADPDFRRFLGYACLIASGQSVSAQFFTVWQIDRHALALPYLTVQVVAGVAAASGLLSMPVAGYLTDRFGSRPVLALATVSVFIPPIIWLFTIPSPQAYWLNVSLIVLLNLISGAGWAVIGLGQFNLLLRTAPPAARATYMALFSASTGLIGGVAPIMGGLFLRSLGGISFAAGPIHFNNYKLLFLLATTLRALSLPFLLRMRESESRSTRFVMEQIVSPRSVNSYRALRRLRKPQRELERQHDVEALATLRSPLAVTELVAALDDVSLDVRERAARALGAIGDQSAAPALITKLTDPAAGIGDVAAEALAAIGAVEGVPEALAAATACPDAGVRSASMRALARIPQGAEIHAVGVALLRALQTANPGICEAACATLSAYGAHVSTPFARDSLARLTPLLGPPEMVARGMRLAAARAIGAIADRLETQDSIAYSTLEERIGREPDPAVRAQEAMALSRLGRVFGFSPERAFGLLLPLIGQPDMVGLAGKQALQALADTVLPPGDFYPYLNLTEAGRDEAFQQILGVIVRREGRRHSLSGIAEPPTRDDRWGASLLALYTDGEYLSCIAAIAATLPETPGSEAAASASAVLLRRLAASAPQRDSRPEEALLALLLLRSAASETQRLRAGKA